MKNNKKSEKPQDSNKADTFDVSPHSLEAEQAVLGSLMLNNEHWDDVSEKVVTADFYIHAHRCIYQEMLTLRQQNKPIDLITLDQELKNKDLTKDVGGFAYLAEISKNTPSTANILAYAEIVAEKAILRSLIAVSHRIAQDSYKPNGKDVAHILDDAERHVFEIAEKRSAGAQQGPKHVMDVMHQTLATIETLLRNKNNGLIGVSTGFTDLDKKTAGLQKSDLIIVAARPSMGKTTFAMNICENVAFANEQDKPVLIFSLEMPAEQLMMRILASLSRVDQTKIRTGNLHDDEDWAKIASTTGLMEQKPNLYIDDSSSLTPTELRARARRLYRDKKGLSLIMVDYLQLMRVPGYQENRHLEIAEISRSLKALAKELQVPIIALSQLNRSLESRADKRPVNSDLRESGAIEQDADLIMFIYRDEVYNEDSPNKGTAEIIIGKQRNGPIGKIRLTFQGKYSRFDNHADGGFIDEY